MRQAARAVGEQARVWTTTGGPIGFKVGLMVGTAIVLTGIVMVAVTREVAAPRQQLTQAPTIEVAPPNVVAPRPALSPAEQTYIEAVWPVHTRVERAVVRVALGAAFYRTRDIDQAELRSRLDQALTIYTGAESQLVALQPPPSLQTAHDGYVEALRMFAASASEMLKTYDDGNEEHLTTGFPLAQQGSDRIREVGSALFPDQYPPN